MQLCWNEQSIKWRTTKRPTCYPWKSFDDEAGRRVGSAIAGARATAHGGRPPQPNRIPSAQAAESRRRSVAFVASKVVTPNAEPLEQAAKVLVCCWLSHLISLLPSSGGDVGH